ncbi:MAG: hypothetical protein AAF718_01890 [Pseudomonadota bacterium]
MRSQSVSFEGKVISLVQAEIRLVEQISDQLAELEITEILMATSLQETKNLEQECRFDFALLDVNLPNGETIEELGSDLAAEGLPVVLFSDFNASDCGHIVRTYEILQKPLSTTRFSESMRKALDRVSAPNNGHDGQKK